MDKELSRKFDKAMASYQVSFEELADILLKRQDEKCLFYLGELAKSHQDIYLCIDQVLKDIKR